MVEEKPAKTLPEYRLQAQEDISEESTTKEAAITTVVVDRGEASSAALEDLQAEKVERKQSSSQV